MLEVNTYSHEGVLVAEVSGPLDSQCSHDLKSWFEDQLKSDQIYVAVDFLDVEYISSTGISVLIQLNLLSKRVGGCLVLFNMNYEISRVINFLKINQEMVISETAEDAIQILLRYKKRHPPSSKKASEALETSPQKTPETSPKEAEKKQTKPATEFRIILCPNCNKKMKTRKQQGRFLCPHCREKFVLKK